MFDFGKHCETKWKIAPEKDKFYVKHDRGYLGCRMKQENGRQIEHELNSACEEADVSSHGTIGTFIDNKLKIIDELRTEESETEESESHVVNFNEQIIETIEIEDAIAACDSSVKGRHIGGHWIIGDAN